MPILWIQKGRSQCSPQCILASKVREALAAAPNPTGCATLVREQPGPSVKAQLMRPNPSPRESCGRDLCPSARAGGRCREKCFRESVAYMGRCLRCAEEQRQGGTEDQDIVWENYQGETSPSIVSRAREHYADYLAAMKKPPPPPTRHRDESPGQAGGGGARGVDWREEEDEEGSSWMADHSRACHRGLASADPREDYDFVVLGHYPKPLQRQIEEAVRIRQVMQKDFLQVGQGPMARKIKLCRCLLNRKIENFSPWFLTLGGGGQDGPRD